MSIHWWPREELKENRETIDRINRRMDVHLTFNENLESGIYTAPGLDYSNSQKESDFGLTLGHYGVGNGPYVVLPIGGPSNARDTLGLAADSAALSLVGPIAWINEPAVSAAYSATYAVDRRYRIPFHYGQTGSPFEYELVRLLYTIRREIDVQQMEPPH